MSKKGKGASTAFKVVGVGLALCAVIGAVGLGVSYFNKKGGQGNVESAGPYEVVFSVKGKRDVVQSLKEGDKLQIPDAPSMRHYDFKGWSVDGGDPITDLSSYDISGDTKFVAVFEHKEMASGLYSDEDELLKSWDQLKSEGLITIEEGHFKKIDPSCSGMLVIDEEVKSFEYALATDSKSSLTGVCIPGTIKEIKGSVFRASFLKYVDLQEGIQIIGGGAFRDLKLQDDVEPIIVPESVTSLGDQSFGSSNVTEAVNLPNLTTLSGSSPFLYCKNLKELHIGKNFNSETVNFGCEDLEVLTIDEENPVYDSRDNCNAIIKTADNELVMGIKTTKIPSSVTKISRFISAPDVLVIPEGVTTIVERLFANDGFENLKYIFIPFSVTSIGSTFVRSNYTTEIFCEVSEKPEGWVDDWHNDTDSSTVHWGVSYEQFLEQIAEA